MLNMGGPSSLEGPEDGVQPFLERLFCDKEIIKMGPLQKYLVRAAGHGAACANRCARAPTRDWLCPVLYAGPLHCAQAIGAHS
jgi:hypothetical protein